VKKYKDSADFIPIAPHHKITHAPGRNKNAAVTAAIYTKQQPDNNRKQQKKHITGGQQARPATNNHNIRTLH
jgi:hypothetical protein